MSPLNLLRVADETLQRNFDRIKQALVSLAPIASAVLTGDIALAIGANTIPSPGYRPRGRIVVYQTAASTITDTGTDANGQLTVNSTAACTCRFLLF